MKTWKDIPELQDVARVFESAGKHLSENDVEMATLERADEAMAQVVSPNASRRSAFVVGVAERVFARLFDPGCVPMENLGGVVDTEYGRTRARIAAGLAMDAAEELAQEIEVRARKGWTR